MNRQIIKWGLFIILSFIWGWSFKLMLIGLENLNSFQVATIRLLSASILALPFAYKTFKKINKNKILDILLSALCGSFFPAYLFCLAEGKDKLDSSFAGILNALTPIFVLLVGMTMYKLKANIYQIIGIVVCFSGSILLFESKGGETGKLIYIFYIILATLFYGFNVNIAYANLKEVSSFQIVVVGFSLLFIPCLIILYFTGFFSSDFSNVSFQKSIAASAYLGASSTTIASILYYELMKREGAIFSSTITYAIPFVSLIIGTYYGEENKIGVYICLAIILMGIYLVNKKVAIKTPVLEFKN